MNSYSLEHAIEQIDYLEKNGLPNILEINNELIMRAYNFSSENDCLIVSDNMGNIMSKKEMQELVDFLNYSIKNIDEDAIIEYKINLLKDDINTYMKPREAEKKQPKNGYIYLIEGENGRFKIGASKNPETRLNQLRHSSCENHKLIHCFKVSGMFSRERELHDLFKNKKSHSEWFLLSEEDIETIKGFKDEI